MVDWRDKGEVFSVICSAYHAEKLGYFGLKEKALKDLGYNPEEVEAMLDCERTAMAAAKKLLFPYLLELFGRIAPENAEEDARPYVDEHNRAIEIFAEISKRPEKPAATV
jgi:hypothetical protein